MDTHTDPAGSALLLADWPAPPGVVAFTTLRHGAGVSQPPFYHFNLGARGGDDPAAVLANRQALARIAGLPSAPHWLRQVHGRDVLRLEVPADPQLPVDAEPEADAAVTSTAGVVLAILSADCLPVVLAAVDGGEVGAAHAGWRGLAGGVLEATVAAMRTPATQLHAWLGPAAGPQNYEIGTEVREAFTATDPDTEAAFIATRPGHWRMDLYALARRRLQAMGIAAAAIHGGGLCTIGDPIRFHSHRRDPRSGRMATLVFARGG